MARNIFFGIGAFALVMMGSAGPDPSHPGLGLGTLSVGGTPALAQRRGGGGVEIPDVLDTLDDLDLLEPDDDDGPDDDGPDDGPDAGDDTDDNDTAAAPPPRRRAAAPPRRRSGDSVCEERARHEDPGREFAGSPCWAREAFSAGRNRR